MNDKVYPGLYPATQSKYIRDLFVFNDEDEIMQKVVHAVCKYFKTEPAYVLTSSNKPEAVRPRHWIYFLAHKYYGLRKVSIAERLKKNHGTIYSGVKKLEGELDVYPEEEEVYKEIIKILENGSS